MIDDVSVEKGNRPLIHKMAASRICIVSATGWQEIALARNLSIAGRPDGSARHPVFFSTALKDPITRVPPPDGFAFAEANCLRKGLGTCKYDCKNATNVPIWSLLSIQMAKVGAVYQGWVARRAICADLARVPRFAKVFKGWLGKIIKVGVGSVRQHHLKGV